MTAYRLVCLARYLGGCFLLVTTTVQSMADTDWQQLLTDKQRQQRVDLNLSQIPIGDAFGILAEQLQLNVIVADHIAGTTSLKLQDVSWIDAVESLSKAHNVAIHLQNNVLWITDTASPNPDSAVGQVELITINFAQASDLAEIITSAGNDFLSPEGALTVDQRTNTLIVNDTETKRKAIKKLIGQLDRPIRQVMIEARMVSLKTNLAREFGVRWGATSNGLASPADTEVNFIRGMQMALPVSQPAATVGLNVARLSDNLLLDLELSALEHENKGEIIASPKIFTANQQPAYIEQGTEIPYVESAASGATAVQFKKAVMGLRVTPHITPNDHVLLDLTITQNTRGDTVSTPTGPAVAIDTQEMGTQVLVKNGETIVLGGIFQTLELKDDTGVPILSSVPFVGQLFKHQRQQQQKRELVIFVTPTILASTE